MLRACGGLPAPHTSPRFLEEPQRSWLAVGPPLPGFLFGLQNRWAVSAAEPGAGWAGGREDTCLVGEAIGRGLGQTSSP